MSTNNEQICTDLKNIKINYSNRLFTFLRFASDMPNCPKDLQLSYQKEMLSLLDRFKNALDESSLGEYVATGRCSINKIIFNDFSLLNNCSITKIIKDSGFSCNLDAMRDKLASAIAVSPPCTNANNEILNVLYDLYRDCINPYFFSNGHDMLGLSIDSQFDSIAKTFCGASYTEL